ncbi:MAG TPA: di-trans,poly-cis-decaprenylcistransferase [Bryobacteraceae bacterium]|jgi:undecaprenyl diphosphate synthase|nr:di-trans,poly-cis-decaprenylcistransferase [Bryobacteraceae bacterium]
MNFTEQSNLHVAIIMDGNGRWATARGLPRVAGHPAGAEALRRIVEAAPGCGIGALTVYAFSSDNWKRPPYEVDALMSLLGCYLARETPRCLAQGVRMTIIGRRDRLPAALRAAMEHAESETRHGRVLKLRLAIDYSARDAILDASSRAAGLQNGLRDAATPHRLTRERFGALLGEARPVDILIRTGGEQRLSDFLLWECAYAELIFTKTMWPDFSPLDLRRAVAQYAQRERRFGAIPQPPPAAREHWLR